jgi:hypothetical protein
MVVGCLRRFDAQEFTDVSDVEALFAELIAWTSAGNWVFGEVNEVVVFSVGS